MYDFIASLWYIIYVYDSFLCESDFEFPQVLDRSFSVSTQHLPLWRQNCQNPSFDPSWVGLTSVRMPRRFWAGILSSLLYTMCDDLNICGHGRCSIFYYDITANLHKIFVGLGLLAILGLWIFKKTCSDNQKMREIEYYFFAYEKESFKHNSSLN